MKVFELYKKGMPIRATFYLIIGICGLITAFMCLVNLILIGVVVGLFFAYLNFSWLPDAYLKEDKEEIDTIDSSEYPYTSTIVPRKTMHSDEPVAYEVSIGYIKALYKNYEYIVLIGSEAFYIAESFNYRDESGKMPPKEVSDKIAEACNNFEPKINPKDGRHYIYLENFKKYSCGTSESYKTLRDSQIRKLPKAFTSKFKEYTKVKLYEKYEKNGEDNQPIYCFKICDMADYFIIEEELHVDKEIYDEAQIGKEYYLFKHYLGDKYEYVIRELSFLEFYK